MIEAEGEQVTILFLFDPDAVDTEEPGELIYSRPLTYWEWRGLWMVGE